MLAADKSVESQYPVAQSGFAVVNETYIKKSAENIYKQAWNTVATYLVEKRGTFGACLHQTEAGTFVAYSRWLDKRAWGVSLSESGEDTSSEVLPHVVRDAIMTMQRCADDERNNKEGIVRELCLEVVKDLLLSGTSHIAVSQVAEKPEDKTLSPFAVIYKTYIKKGEENTYKQAWNTVASYFVEKRGALGSCLHQTEEGLFVPYSRWPDKKTRDASWPGENAPSDVLPDAVRQAIMTMKRCADDERNQESHVVPELRLGVIDDLLLPKASKNVDSSATSESRALVFQYSDYIAGTALDTSIGLPFSYTPSKFSYKH